MLKRLSILVLLAAMAVPLAGCVVELARPYPAAHWVPGHYGPGGYWHSGHWQ